MRFCSALEDSILSGTAANFIGAIMRELNGEYLFSRDDLDSLFRGYIVSEGHVPDTMHLKMAEGVEHSSRKYGPFDLALGAYPPPYLPSVHVSRCYCVYRV